MRRLVASSLCALAVAASGCGLKGPLYLPEKPGEVVVRPAPGATPPATPPATPAEPATTTPATPAPPPPQAPPTGPGARG
jgi:predicted small lipoprotein YifL